MRHHEQPASDRLYLLLYSFFLFISRFRAELVLMGLVSQQAFQHQTLKGNNQNLTRAHEIKTERPVSLVHACFFWQVLKLLARAALTRSNISARQAQAPTLSAAASGGEPQQDPGTRHAAQPSSLTISFDFSQFPTTTTTPSTRCK